MLALEHRGFTVTGSTLRGCLRDGVVAQRAGDHGEAVMTQWEQFAHLSDDAAQVFEMALDLGVY